MECLDCGHIKTKVMDSICYAGSVYRRRKCIACNFTFWTEELECIDPKIITEAYNYKNSLRGKKKG